MDGGVASQCSYIIKEWNNCKKNTKILRYIYRLYRLIYRLFCLIGAPLKVCQKGTIFLGFFPVPFPYLIWLEVWKDINQWENFVSKREIPVVPILSVTSFFLETVSQMLTTSKLSGMVVTSKWLFIHPCAIFIRHLPNPLLQFNKNRVHLLSTLQRAMKMIS